MSSNHCLRLSHLIHWARASSTAILVAACNASGNNVLVFCHTDLTLYALACAVPIIDAPINLLKSFPFNLPSPTWQTSARVATNAINFSGFWRRSLLHWTTSNKTTLCCSIDCVARQLHPTVKIKALLGLSSHMHGLDWLACVCRDKIGCILESCLLPDVVICLWSVGLESICTCLFWQETCSLCDQWCVPWFVVGVYVYNQIISRFMLHFCAFIVEESFSPLPSHLLCTRVECCLWNNSKQSTSTEGEIYGETIDNHLHGFCGVTMQFNLSVLNYCRITNRSEGGTQLYLSIFPHHHHNVVKSELIYL